MKKVSTVAAMQSRNFSQPKLTIGLDLGDRSSWYCVLDEAGTIVREQRDQQIPKRIPLTPTGLLMEGDHTHDLNYWDSLMGAVETTAGPQKNGPGAQGQSQYRRVTTDPLAGPV